MNNEILEKARKTAVKYVRRVPKPTGKGWYYFYTVQQYEHYQKTGDPGAQNKKPAGFFDAVKDFFGFGSVSEAQKYVQSDYNNHEIKQVFGIDLTAWIKHVSEYFTNKEKWDAFFNRQAVPKEKAENTGVKTNADKGKKVKNGEKSFELGVMRYIFSQYNDMKPAAGGQNEHRTNQSDVRPGKLSADKPAVRGGTVERHTIRDVPEKQPSDNGGEPLQSGVGTGVRLAGDVFVKVGKKQAKDIRQRCLDLLNEKTNEQMTEEDKILLRQYEGAGGLKEGTGERLQASTAFYTPVKVVNKIWDIVNKYVAGKGALDVLEPSAATGRFMENPEHNYDAVEINPTSARINKILHPNANVKEGTFQSLFFDTETGRIHQKEYTGKKYDVIIGNPPYMEYKGPDTKKEGKEHNRYEEYFIERGLDTLKDGGLMAFIVPSAFMRKDSNAKIKEMIASKGKLMEAWRIPNGTFSSTAVGTDIIVIRKEKGNVDDFIGDKFFLDNPQNVLGDEVMGIDQFGKPCKYIRTKNGETFDDALNNVDVSKHDVPQIGEKPMSQQQKDKISIGLAGNDNAKKDVKAEPKKRKKEDTMVELSAPKQTQSAEEFNALYNRHVKPEELDAWKVTTYDGSIDLDKMPAKSLEKLKASGDLFKLEGKTFHRINFASGDLYGKIEQLAIDLKLGNVSENEYSESMKVLTDALPARKTSQNIFMSPQTELAKTMELRTEDGSRVSLMDRFWEWAGITGRNKQWQDFDAGVSKRDIPINADWSDIVDYIEGIPTRGITSKDANTALIAAKKREQRRDAAEAIFDRFIKNGLNEFERNQMEEIWNRRFNSNVDPDYKKIPVFINGISTTFKGEPLEVREIQLKGIAMLGNKGNGLLAYGTGSGKTMTGIIATVQQLQTGKAKAPMICVPTAVLENWIKETRDLFPNIQINVLGNMSDEYTRKLPKNEDGTFNLNGAINIMSYEGLRDITFKKETMEGELFQDIIESQKLEGEKTERQEDSENESLLETLSEGTSVNNRVFYFEDLGIDHMTFDEVHNAKNIFEGAKAPSKKDSRGKETQQANEYAAIKGSSSKRGMKTFMISQYIQAHNNDRNVLLLSATPFTNSPLEVYNILSLMARKRLKDLGIYNIHEFMAQFAKLKSEWAVGTNGQITRKSVMKDFSNLSALQNLIKEYIDRVTSADAGVGEPERIIGQTKLKMTELQELMMEAEQLRMADRGKENPAGAIVGVNNTRMSTVSPLLVKLDGYHAQIPGLIELYNKALAEGFVETSPKMKFVMGTTIDIHKKRPDLGQFIYLPTGKKWYKKCVKYLVQNGIKKESIAIIDGGVKTEERERIMADFNNPDGKIKIIIGSSATREGVNLNGNTIVGHNCLLDWNPDVSTQVEGRYARQGNLQDLVHCSYPQMVNSVDASMYQKHDEKRSRFEGLWKKDGSDTLDVSAINPAELKFDLIKDPKRRAKFRIDLEKEKIEGIVNDLGISIDTLAQLKKEHASNVHGVTYYGKQVEESIKERDEAKASLVKLKSVPVEEQDSWDIRNATREIESANENILEYRKSEKKAAARIATIELTFKQKGNLTIETIDDEIKNLTHKKELMEVEVKTIADKLDEYIELATRELMDEKSQKIPSVDESIRQYSDFVLGNMREKPRKVKMQKALYIIGNVVTVKRLNSETGLFQYFRTVR